MNNIGIVTDEDFGLVSKKNTNPKIKVGVRGIVINNNGKIAIFYNIKKNEYKLIGDNVTKNKDIKKTFERNFLEKTGCRINIIKKLGVIEEHRTLNNYIQKSHIFVAKVIEDTREIKFIKRRKEEDGKILWVEKEEALRLISESIDNLKSLQYEDLYHRKFIAFTDKKILEYYLNIIKSENQWNLLYKKYIDKNFENWDQYFKTKMKLKKRFIKLIMKYSKNGKAVLECGCGTGKTSVYLATLGLNVYAMDIENAMVKETIELSDKYSPNNKVNVFEGDINSIPFKDKFFSVTHSSGVLEHFSDEEIIKIINEQLRVSDICIFSVPTSYFEKKMLGNERFMNRREWRKIILQSNAKIIKETGYHYKTFNKRILDIVKKPKRLFKPIALYIFVLKERND